MPKLNDSRNITTHPSWDIDSSEYEAIGIVENAGKNVTANNVYNLI